MSEKKKSNISIILALITLAGTISVAIIQAYKPGSDDVDGVVQKLKGVVKQHESVVTQLNNILVPRIEKEILVLQNRNFELLERNAKLRERLARLEAQVGVIHTVAAKPRSMLDKAAHIGHNVVTGVVEDLKPAQKKMLPKIRIKQ